MTRPACAPLLALAVLACSPIPIDKQADHIATLQFNGPLVERGTPAFAILRAAGDEVTVIALGADPKLGELGPLLAGRGLARVRALILTVAPNSTIELPRGIRIDAIYSPAAAATSSGSNATVVSAPVQVALSGLTVEVSPCESRAAPTGLVVDIRHAGNHMLLVPDVAGAAAEIDKRTRSGEVDLLGVVSAATLDQLRGIGGLDRAQIVVGDRAGAARNPGSPSAVSLADAHRVLFQSEEGRRPVRIDTVDAHP